MIIIFNFIITRSLYLIYYQWIIITASNHNIENNCGLFLKIITIILYYTYLHEIGMAHLLVYNNIVVLLGIIFEFHNDYFITVITSFRSSLTVVYIVFYTHRSRISITHNIVILYCYTYIVYVVKELLIK